MHKTNFIKETIKVFNSHLLLFPPKFAPEYIPKAIMDRHLIATPPALLIYVLVTKQEITLLMCKYFESYIRLLTFIM